MSTDLKKFEQTRKMSIANTIGSTLRMGMEELGRTVSGSKKSPGKKMLAKNQISRELDKYEDALIQKRKNR